jgi:hypothetical protein
LPFAVLGASLLISYERAKAESLGFEAKGGLMERAERIVVLCAGLAFSFLLVPVLWVLLALTLVTAGQRFVKVWRQATHAMRAPAAAPVETVRPAETARPAATGRPADVGHPSPAGTAAAADGADPMALAGRWRAWREANGWTPRQPRYTTRSGSAAARWHERRQSRLTRRRDDDQSAPPARRLGSRRP